MSDERHTSRSPVQVWVRNVGKNDVREWLDDETLSDDFSFMYSTQDISEGGLFLESDSPLAVGEILDLEITIPGHAPFVVKTQVKWSRDAEEGARQGFKPGMGLEYIDLSAEAAGVIRTFLGLEKVGSE